MSGLDIHPLAGALGAEVTGIDLRTVTAVEALEGLKKALAENLVVFNENFTCRLRWDYHTRAIWDNRCTVHNAVNDYPGARREVFRTSVKGGVPEPVG
jgi:alpha-ketoglutarate-dependent taurine dioxygenase